MSLFTDIAKKKNALDADWEAVNNGGFVYDDNTVR